MFHGSYRPEDVTFLLKPIEIEFIEDLPMKEVLIQSGQRHYSEMLSPERLPSPHYLDLFERAHAENRAQLAADCLALAEMLIECYGHEVAIVSLARAGTPIGAIVHHLIDRVYGGHSSHYSISIIRDRGIDAVALDAILARGHAPEHLAFVDGWTGKGVISRELDRSVRDYNAQNGVALNPGLNVLTDLAGTAARAASSEDYLIASSILNSTISGLVSRSILNAAIGPGDYHGCVYFDAFQPHDLSRWFVDDMVAAAQALHGERCNEADTGPRIQVDRRRLAAISGDYMKSAMRRFGVADVNLIKPGIGEATRVLLRRQPERVIVRDPDGERVAHLIALAREKAVRVDVDPHLPYHAVSIISAPPARTPEGPKSFLGRPGERLERSRRDA